MYNPVIREHRLGIGLVRTFIIIQYGGSLVYPRGNIIVRTLALLRPCLLFISFVSTFHFSLFLTSHILLH